MGKDQTCLTVKQFSLALGLFDTLEMTFRIIMMIFFIQAEIYGINIIYITLEMWQLRIQGGLLLLALLRSCAFFFLLCSGKKRFARLCSAIVRFICLIGLVAISFLHILEVTEIQTSLINSTRIEFHSLLIWYVSVMFVMLCFLQIAGIMFNYLYWKDEEDVAIPTHVV